MKILNIAEKPAIIARLDQIIIQRFAVILQTMTSGSEINTDKFAAYTFEIAQLYSNLYNWYYMPVTFHKISLHGANIIKSFIIPIGRLFEEPQDARNKDVKRYREYNTRKRSRFDKKLKGNTRKKEDFFQRH